MAIRTRNGRLPDEQALRHPAREARAKAETGRGWYAWLARTGLVAKGISFGIVGVLAIKLAVGDGGKATSRQGALQSIAHHGWGKLLLVGLALGFAAYALWRVVQAFAEREPDDDEASGLAKKWGKRVGYVGRALIYAGLTYTAVKIVTGSGEQSQNERAHKSTATVLDWPAGRWIVGAVGIAIAAAGVWNLYRGLSRSFEKRWRIGAMNELERKWGSRVGVAGHLSRFVVFGLIGIFVVKAAIDFDPKSAVGFDGALQKLSHSSYGPYALGFTAAGLLCYGAFCLVDARYRDVSA